MMQLICVPPGLVNDIRPLVEPFVDRATSRNGWDKERPSIWRDLERGDALIWIAADGDDIRACAVTSIRQDERGRLCWIVLVAGVKAAIMPFVPEIEAYAKRERCNRMATTGRVGSARWIKWPVIATGPDIVLEKAI